jgi:hypothetical protein
MYCGFIFGIPPNCRSGSSLQQIQFSGAGNAFGAVLGIQLPKDIIQSGLCGIHSLNKVVFPGPAGAETSVSFRSIPARSRSVRRDRKTRLERGLGI